MDFTNCILPSSCHSDKEDCRLVSRGAVQRGPPGGAAQWRDAGGAEGCRHRPLQRWQRESPGHHKRLCSRLEPTSCHHLVYNGAVICTLSFSFSCILHLTTFWNDKHLYKYLGLDMFLFIFGCRCGSYDPTWLVFKKLQCPPVLFRYGCKNNAWFVVQSIKK